MEKSRMESNQSHETTEIKRLIANLSDKDSKVRENARHRLVVVGQPAIVPLLNQLRSPDKWLRWEAAKALAEMREPCVAPILVDFLTNSDSNIRWLAAEGLIALGSISLEPLLEALTQYSGSLPLAEGAHHVLHDLFIGGVHEGEKEYEPLNPLTDKTKSLIKPVLDSIGTSGSSILTPEYAKVALNDLRRTEDKSSKSTSQLK